MIPKTIHYCWFGGNPLPRLAKKCIKSWKKYCPGYEIVEWNEDNYDLSSAPLYVRQAYEAKKWAFVTDYVRLQVVYEHGGIYLDTDVEVIRSLDAFLSHKAFFGYESGTYIATGLGFGAEKGTPILKEMMDDYAEIPFQLPDGTFDQTTCPVRNTQVFLRYGLKQDDSFQNIGGIAVYPTEYFCPIDLTTNHLTKTPNTAAIHWFSGSWVPEEELKAAEARRKKRRAAERKEYWRYLPNRILLKLLGQERYEKLKGLFKKG